jgi:hypothetical protein
MMDLAPTLPAAVYTIWIVALVLVALLAPVVVLLLHRTLGAARMIRRYVAEMEAAAADIARNTAAIEVLADTRSTALDLLATAGELSRHSGVIAEVMRQRASSAGSA